MRTEAGMSSLLVSPTRGCRSSPSTISSATFVKYSWARWTGLRVWNPTIVFQPRALLTAWTCDGVRSYAGNPDAACTSATTPPAIAHRPDSLSTLTPGCASSSVPYTLRDSASWSVWKAAVTSTIPTGWSPMNSPIRSAVGAEAAQDDGDRVGLAAGQAAGAD